MRVPLDLILPHSSTCYTALNGPLHVLYPSWHPALLVLLNHTGRQKSLILHCGGDHNAESEGTFLDGFWGMGWRYGRFVRAASQIEVIQIESLFELRSVLKLLAFEGMEKEVADSESEVRKAVLMIHGFDKVHQEAGLWSAQGMSLTIACAMDAADAMDYELVICDDSQGEVSVVDAAGQLPAGLLDLKVPIDEVYKQFCKASWRPDLHKSEGEWLDYESGEVARVTWTEDGNDGFVNSQATVK